MSHVMIKETTVYTLEELKQLDDGAYEKAIDHIISMEWEFFEPELLTEDIVYNISENYPLFTLDRDYRGKTSRPYLYWNMNPYSVEAKGTLDIMGFMKKMKLCNKYRLIWGIMRDNGLRYDAPVAFGMGRKDDVDLSDLLDEIVYCDETPRGSKRDYRIEMQIKYLEGEIGGYIGQIYSAVVKHLHAEDKYRCSEEFAKEAAEANEWLFTANGKIYH